MKFGLVWAWWREYDQFERVSAFLRHQGLLRTTRAAMATIVASAALIPISAMMPSPHSSPYSLVTGIVGATLCVVMTWCWLTRWPTGRLSLCAVMLGSACAATWSLTQPSPALAALACTTLIVTGGYIAFFHSFRFVLLNAVLAAAAAAVAAIRLGHDLGVPTGLAAFWIMWLPNFAIPLGVRCLSNALTVYAIRSDEDPLTGLLNRRGFGEVIGRRLIPEVCATPGMHLAIVMIDIDDFKRVNDTHGHPAGDRILSKVAELLRSQTPLEAALCRAGGEEFLVALASPTCDAADLTEPLCEAIRTQCGGITASIGVAAASPREIRAVLNAPDGLIDGLIEAADHAMYEAKRNGGNRVRLAQAHHRR